MTGVLKGHGSYRLAGLTCPTTYGNTIPPSLVGLATIGHVSVRGSLHSKILRAPGKEDFIGIWRHAQAPLYFIKVEGMTL